MVRPGARFDAAEISPMDHPSERWWRAAAIEEIPEGHVIAAKVARKSVALCKFEGRIYATDDMCTHDLVRLSDGYLDGCIIVCPLHQGMFDIRTGKALCDPVTVDLPVYPVRIAGHDVFVRLDVDT
jgi:naphthalene 1,2-dioxygenase system ferredoxin subunit